MKVVTWFSAFIFIFVGVCKVHNMNTPVVLMHGIAANSSAVEDVKIWIEEEYGAYVLNMETGNGYWSSFFMNLNDQVDEFAAKVKQDPKLANGFHLIAHSQGGMVSRGFVERHNDPPVKTFITLSSPHGGQFGVPKVDDVILEEIIRALKDPAYFTFSQEHVTFLEYWKDPFDFQKYLDKSAFLADLNNERDVKNETYKENLSNLEGLVLVASDIDATIVPRYSAFFDFYAEHSDVKMTIYNESQAYKDDWIGLKSLNEQGKLNYRTIHCNHADETTDACKDQVMPIIREFLDPK